MIIYYWKGLEKFECPTYFPFAFDNGLKCCKHYKKKSNVSLHWQCDGTAIHFNSPPECCFNNEFIHCPSKELKCGNNGIVETCSIINPGNKVKSGNKVIYVLLYCIFCILQLHKASLDNSLLFNEIS